MTSAFFSVYLVPCVQLIWLGFFLYVWTIFDLFSYNQIISFFHLASQCTVRVESISKEVYCKEQEQALDQRGKSEGGAILSRK